MRQCVFTLSLCFALFAGEAPPKSLSKLAFSPDGVLFVGDSIGARIFALELEDKVRTEAKSFELKDVESRIAGLIGSDSRDVLIHDMAVNPLSKNVYLAVSRGRRNLSRPFELPNHVANAAVLLRITPQGTIDEVKLSAVKHTSVELTNPIDEVKEIGWMKAKSRTDAISDMAFAGGKLYVAGLSNEEFASALRIYSYPFNGPASLTTLEIYHGAHGKYETASPIRTFMPYAINGKQYILASYLCTPLVLFRVDDLKDKSHVKGQTIAELGSGNYPLDMVSFRSGNKDQIMIVNSTRGLMRIKAEELGKPLPSITTPAEPETGVKAEHLRGQGTLRADNYGDKFLMMLARDPFTGSLNLATTALDR